VSTTPLRLVTIVGEAVLAERLPGELRALGASGWTMCEARGDGARGVRTSPFSGGNVRLETIVSAETAQLILDRLAVEYFPNFALVAWVSDVEVVRGDKYR
jgi:nitrogen regulatory protein P-II 2